MSESIYKPKYITIEDVKLELQGKIIFSNGDDQYLSDNMIYDKIAKGESLVELELSRIYHIPFCGEDDEPFHLIPDIHYSSKQFISTLSLFQTCIFLLDTFYTRSDGNVGEGAKENYIKRIKEFKAGILDKEDISFYWKNPPLPGLKLNYNASWANAAMPAPANAIIGYNDVNKQLIQRKLTNPNSNWWTPNYPWN